MTAERCPWPGCNGFHHPDRCPARFTEPKVAEPQERDAVLWTAALKYVDDQLAVMRKFGDTRKFGLTKRVSLAKEVYRVTMRARLAVKRTGGAE